MQMINLINEKKFNKSLARYLSVQAIYQKIISKISFEEILEQFEQKIIDIFYGFENSLSKLISQLILNILNKLLKILKLKKRGN